MSDNIQIDKRGEYISSVICQRIHELIVAIHEGKSTTASEELINVFLLEVK